MVGLHWIPGYIKAMDDSDIMREVYIERDDNIMSKDNG
jgi:hypothetical protein